MESNLVRASTLKKSGGPGSKVDNGTFEISSGIIRRVLEPHDEKISSRYQKMNG